MNARPTHYSFQSTQWSVVLKAGLADESGREAMDSLCQSYWYPLYAFARRHGLNRNDSQDRVQGFFLKILQKSTLDHADRNRGRFRSFLLSCFKNFLNNEWHKSQALKRGGGEALLSLSPDAEDRYQRDPSHELTAEKLYDKAWCLTLLERVLERLAQHYREKQQADIFQALKDGLTGAQGDQIQRWAKDFERSEGAIRVMLHRMRGKYRDMLRLEVANTLERGDNIDDELETLFSSLSA